MSDLTATAALQALVTAVLVAGAGIALGVILSVIGALALGAAGAGLVVVLVATLVLTQGIAFGGVAVGYLTFRGLGIDYVSARVPTLRDLLWVGGGYLLAFGAVFAGAFLVSLVEVEPAANQISELGIENPDLLLLLIPLSFLLIGPGEELLFRGVVQGRLRETFGPVSGIVLASAIFAAIHFTALVGSAGGRLATIAILFFPSLVFGTVYEVTDNIVVPALIHGAYNATLFAALYYAIRYMDVTLVV